METRTVFFGEEGQKALQEERCPYCEADMEGFLFGGSDGRDGGFATCQHCKIDFAWIENPFECEVKENDHS